jgi:hypothetical protein
VSSSLQVPLVSCSGLCHRFQICSLHDRSV